MCFSTCATDKQYFHSSIFDLIGCRIHLPMTCCCSITRNIAIDMERYEAIRAMISTGLIGLRDGLFALYTYEVLVYLLHYMGSNAKTTKWLNDSEFLYLNLSLRLQGFAISTLYRYMVFYFIFSMYLYIMILMCLQISTKVMKSFSCIYFLE